MNPSLVDYTDCDESQSPSTNHDQFNSSCQVLFFLAFACISTGMGTEI